MADQVRMEDIIKRAGVSAGTVDRVLHERGEVSAETKELVLKLLVSLIISRMLRLNYLKNHSVIKSPF